MLMLLTLFLGNLCLGKNKLDTNFIPQKFVRTLNRNGYLFQFFYDVDGTCTCVFGGMW